MFTSTEVVANEGTHELALLVEPWAREYALPSGAAYVVRAKSSVPGALEIERASGRVTCWAGLGSTVEVWTDERLVDSLDQPVPDVPAGRSVRQFLRLLLDCEGAG